VYKLILSRSYLNLAERLQAHLTTYVV